jgi:hypothetical protein
MRTSSRLALASLVGATAIGAPPALAANTIKVTAPKTVKAGKKFTVVISGHLDRDNGAVLGFVQNASKACPTYGHHPSSVLVNRSLNKGPFNLRVPQKNKATKKIKRRFCIYLINDNSMLVGTAHADYTLNTN